ncbi:hypothetical protein DEU56DRAFT_920426 [Suillus clintonianus]|uniref:uncharacterized protein n=1 Tax=Suillus clintonianus TaxID=1904413 RepID=UPI001B87833A|nr:uncharacterized protein DEU56DRAFT_920426 [Suillus clintonianus]KAG2108880.1 hypothetical protein DEU56DRAFT_920426 [Suillus clintonianus]
MVTPLNDNAIPPATVEYLLRPRRNHNPPPAHVSSEIRSYIMRYNRTPTRGPIFTPVQKDWLKDHIPQYMQWPPTSDETITFVQTMLIDFDHMWPLHQKLWPGSNVHILLTDSMHAKLTVEMLILRGNIKGHMLWTTRRNLRCEKNRTGIKLPSSSRTDTMVSVRLDGLINLLQCLSLDDQKTLSQALDIGTDTGTEWLYIHITSPSEWAWAYPLAAPKWHWLLFPAVSDDPPATTIDIPRELAPFASLLAQLLPIVLAPLLLLAPATAHAAAPPVVVPAGQFDATPPLYYVTRGRYIGIFSGWDATGPKVLGVSRAIYHKVDSIEQGINIVKGAIDRGDASQAL